jgi:hypothetical protein
MRTGIVLNPMGGCLQSNFQEVILHRYCRTKGKNNY